MSDRRSRLGRADVCPLLLSLALLLSIVGVARHGERRGQQEAADSCAPLALSIDQRGGVVAHICGFVPGPGLLLPIRYDLTVRLQLRRP